MNRIAIVGMACRYPDAAGVSQLWENILSGRRAFRALPKQRISEDYYSSDPAAEDRHYATKAAVIESWVFDRARHRVSGQTYRSTDLSHWLALDTAAEALEDAGHPGAEGLEKARTTVILGNTLTGEFSRANLMRLRWPYVRRTLAAELAKEGWENAKIGEFLGSYEESYKSAFPPISEDTLAGGLANTIAGRICNHYDLGGGGYTVDGACSSSILAVINGAVALADGQIDTAIVGGVDLSLDPFELVGFARTGALARSEMRVYDRRSNGFWPGEGCGVLVLMREEDAVRRGQRIYATLTGWGYSSDGNGGITRPEAAGHRRAIDRAYAMAGYGFETLGYVEGHGTGTPLGDETELGVFDAARKSAGGGGDPVPVGTVKGNIGHTKAAAGVAGLIKATLAVHHGVIPPVTGNTSPHDLFGKADAAIRLARNAEEWPPGPRRAGVSSMGFGGINGHLTIEGAGPAVRRPAPRQAARLGRSRQDCEILVISAEDNARLAGRLREVADFVAQLSYAELGDLAGELARTDQDHLVRAAVVASDPAAATASLRFLADRVEHGTVDLIDASAGRFLGHGDHSPRIGLMFPGQGAPGGGDGGATARRFAVVEEFYRQVGPVRAGVSTQDAQPRIVAASVAGLRILAAMGVQASGSVGHSLGELTALHWGGSFSERQLLEIATERGRLMAEASPGGAMASLRASVEETTPLLADSPVVIAGFNGAEQTVVSGPSDSVELVVKTARSRGIGAATLQVSHAFHSPEMAPAAEGLRRYLDLHAPVEVVSDGVFSTVTGDRLRLGTSVPELLEDQVLKPVRFDAALEHLSAQSDLLLEVGPGNTLTGLASVICPETPAVAMATDGDSLQGVLTALAASYVVGASPDLHALAADRFTRPLEVGRELSFLESPCEQAPEAFHIPHVPPGAATPAKVDEGEGSAVSPGADALETLRVLFAERVELPLSDVTAHTRPLDELHLSSITVTQISGEAARALGVVTPALGTNMATATIADIAEVLDAARAGDDTAGGSTTVAGVAPWVRTFTLADASAPCLSPTALATDFGAARESQELPGRDGSGSQGWRYFGPPGDALARTVVEMLAAVGAREGVLLRVDDQDDDPQVDAMLSAARAAVASRGAFVVLDGARGAAGLAKAVHLEHPDVPTTVIQLPLGGLEAIDTTAEQICRDVLSTQTFREVHYSRSGERTAPVLNPMSLADAGSVRVLGPDDVLLVTGGARGISLECAEAIAGDSGCSLALVGRTEADDPNVAAALERLTDGGVKAQYYAADVTSAESVRSAVGRVHDDLGPVTAILHGAGINQPAPLRSLTTQAFMSTLRTKVDGLEHLLAAVDTSRLRLLVAFGSIIGRAGLAGEAHYATANDRLRRRVEELQAQLPHCRCLTIEWSVWSGAGMGERLGVLDALVNAGIQPIPLDDGVAMLRRLLTTPQVPTTVVVMGRADSLPTISFAEVEVPLLRFLERPVVHVPGVELVVEADLSTEADPYLLEHDLDGALLFPAVMGMEAMAQAARVLVGDAAPTQFHDVRFEQPVVVTAGRKTTIRVAALAGEDGVRVTLRSSETGYHTDHFTARLVVEEPGFTDPVDHATHDRDLLVPVDVAVDCYDEIMFQGPRFQAVRSYSSIEATSCIARIDISDRKDWFGTYLPADLLLTSPAARDAFMHGIQVCVPEATLLPAGGEALLGRPVPADHDHLWLHARERACEGDTFWYDLCAVDDHGHTYAEWHGLELHAVRTSRGDGPWRPELLGPYLERRLRVGHDGGLRVGLQRDGSPSDLPGDGLSRRRAETARVASTLLGMPADIAYRDDGRPSLPDRHLSASHSDGVTMVAIAADALGCDLQTVAERDRQTWTDLLGGDGVDLASRCAETTGEGFDTSATRVWAAREAITKLGRTVVPADLHPTGKGIAEPGWVAFAHGADHVLTFSTIITGAGSTGRPSIISLARRSSDA